MNVKMKTLSYLIMLHEISGSINVDLKTLSCLVEREDLLHCLPKDVRDFYYYLPSTILVISAVGISFC